MESHQKVVKSLKEGTRCPEKRVDQDGRRVRPRTRSERELKEFEKGKVPIRERRDGRTVLDGDEEEREGSSGIN